jgi:drug/metabolite transporter (DMT)-like permease
MWLQLGAIACVFGTAMGQILFKLGANSLNEADNLYAVRPVLILLTAFAVYFLTSLAWVLVLKKAPLGQMYPFLALSFVVVPLASKYVFGENFTISYFAGVALIMMGIFLCVRAS